MQNTSALYKSILQSPSHFVEQQVVIAGVTYSQSDLISIEPSGGLYEQFGIGNCASRQLSLSLIPQGDIPRAAEIDVFSRLVDGSQTSEWLPKGVFFISTRQLNKTTGEYQFTAFDAMLKAEQTWLDASHAPVSWPMSQADAVADIASKMGVTVDPRTTLTTDFPVEFPVGEEGEYSMREVLSYIAVSNAGNWIITDAGQLRLIRRSDLPPSTHYLITNQGNPILFGGVRILV